MTRILEVDENGELTLPAEMLIDANPHTRYRVDVEGEKITLTPQSGPRRRTKSVKQWTREWNALVEQLRPAWKDDKSIVETLSDMRR